MILSYLFFLAIILWGKYFPKLTENTQKCDSLLSFQTVKGKRK
jgi:hypothetical protein